MFHSRYILAAVVAAFLLTLGLGRLMAQDAPGGAAMPAPVQAELEKQAAVLKSDAPYEQKLAACKRLAAIGGKESVAALAPLLSDEKLSHAARLGLEAIADPAAGDALRAALASVKGKLLVGIINSIGVRRDPGATADLVQRLGDPDSEVASAAAVALGRIATPEAAQAIQQAMSTATAAIRPALAEGCLSCAEARAAQGKREEAAALYDRVRTAELPRPLRVAATRGAILARQTAGVPLLVEQLRAEDRAMFALALELARVLPGAEVTTALVGQLAALAPDRQALLLTALGDRRDAAARPAVVEAAKGAQPRVRAAALRALASLGDASVIPLLMEAAGQPEPEVASAAQDSLTAMASAEVDAAVGAMLDKTEGKSRLFVLDLVGRRRIASAVPALVKTADDPDEETRLAAIRALGRTIAAGQLPELTKRLLAPATPKDAAAVQEALRAACARSADKEACAEKLTACMAQASPEVKTVLIELLGSVGGPTALKAVSGAAFDPSEAIQDTATRILGQWMSPDAAPTLLEVARKSPNGKFQVRTLRGFIRIVRQLDVADDQRLAMCREAMALAQRDEEKALAIEALGRIPSRDAMALVLPHLQTAALKEAASAAAVSIAEKIVASQRAAVAEAMQQVVQASASQDVVRRAKELLAQADAKP